jgi:hypothetical protein
MSVMTAGYSVAAVILWVAGMSGTQDVLASAPLGTLTLVAAVAWTAAVTVYLLWTWLGRADEQRLEAALRAAYPEVDPSI